MAKRLLTLVQISDLHFGDLGEDGEIVYDRSMKTLWTLLPSFRGLAGHEPQALRDLVDFLDAIRQEEPPATVLLTGDLTSTGKKGQYETVAQFMGGELTPPRGTCGLSEAGWRMRAIPGNHDHWPGRFWVLGPPPSHLLSWAAEFPLLQESAIELPGTDVRLRFLAVNTDAEVFGWGLERVLARGSFLSQLRRLAKLLAERGEPEENEIRVLLLHHSLAYKAPAGPMATRWAARLPLALRGKFRRSALGSLEINAASRTLLRSFLARFDVPVILTGHTHEPMVGCFLASSRNPPRMIPFLEACCGTTTQANHVPSKWPEHLPSRALDPNTLLVHRIERHRDARIVWRTETYWRSPLHGFARVGGDDTPDFRWPLSAELTVWPRRRPPPSDAPLE